ncbi:hypothetical protein E4U41_002700 [Claviceps citrina]|nr:hypothetical protein E4U41_002700 [Claviceps citrina]
MQAAMVAALAVRTRQKKATPGYQGKKKRSRSTKPVDEAAQRSRLPEDKSAQNGARSAKGKSRDEKRVVGEKVIPLISVRFDDQTEETRAGAGTGTGAGAQEQEQGWAGGPEEPVAGAEWPGWF